MGDKAKKATGALSPRVGEIIEKASKDRNYGILAQYLQTRDRVPNVSLGDTGDADGYYQNGNITLNTRAQPSRFDTGILTHEMVHAADTAMGLQHLQRRRESGGDSRQFIEAYQKMQGTPGLAKTYPEWFNANAGYRASASELPAWAIGNNYSGVGEFDTRRTVPPHVNAQAATDFMVLLELAQRDAAKPQQPTGVVEYFKSLFGK